MSLISGSYSAEEAFVGIEEPLLVEVEKAEAILGRAVIVEALNTACVRRIGVALAAQNLPAASLRRGTLLMVLENIVFLYVPPKILSDEERKLFTSRDGGVVEVCMLK